MILKVGSSMNRKDQDTAISREFVLYIRPCTLNCFDGFRGVHFHTLQNVKNRKTCGGGSCRRRGCVSSLISSRRTTPNVPSTGLQTLQDGMHGRRGLLIIAGFGIGTSQTL